MSDKIPELTLDAAAVEEVPTLTLTPEAPKEPKVEEKKVEPVAMDDVLSEEELRRVEEFAQKINVRDSSQILNYGAASQEAVAKFSESALSNVCNKDMGEIGKDLSQLVAELKGFGEEDEKKGLFSGLFKKARSRMEVMKAQYNKVGDNVEKIAQELQSHQIGLMKDVAMFDQMYELNLKYFKELTMYILAGKKHLEQIRATEVEELRTKAEASGLAEDAQAYNDLVNLCGRFEKKLHDLELTRMISVQMGPQIRLLQNNDTLMIEKLQTSILSTIPLWKSQMVMALGMENSRQATQAQNQVTDMTNQLLQQNAEALKMGTIATAKESERSIVDMETLQHTNEQLISTLDEVMAIQKEGREKRQAAEAELGRIEGELKAKLLELRD